MSERAKREICVSTDVEADGPIPGPHSMFSFGSAAFSADAKLLSTFPPSPHTHVALDDVIEQGKLFCNMLEEHVNRS